MRVQQKKIPLKLNGKEYTIDKEGAILDGDTVVGTIGRFIVQPTQAGAKVSGEFVEAVEAAINDGKEEFVLTDEEGNENTYMLTYKADSETWSVIQETKTYVYDRYSKPSKTHWLGTDTNGMDMLTRLMYGGRVSLVIGFIVVYS